MSRIETHGKKRSKLLVPLLWMGVIVAIALVVSGLYVLVYPFPSEEKVDYFSGNHSIIYDAVIHDQALVMDEQVYLPFEFVQQFIDPTMIFDTESESVIITTIDKVIQMPQDQLAYFMNEESFAIEHPAVVTEDNKKYISLDSLGNLYPIQINHLEETGAVWVKRDGQVERPAMISSELNEHERRLRVEPSIKAAYVADVSAGEKVWIEREQGSYYFIRKANGEAGFMNKQFILSETPYVLDLEWEQAKRPVVQLDWPINLTWEAVYSVNPNTDTLPEMPGINIVSPTWFKIKNADGDIENLGSEAYVRWAKEKGFQIWALFANDFQDTQMSHEVFSSFETRQKMIRQLLQYAHMYELDGINVDIENINLQDGQHITQFMRELTPYLHQAGLVVSMDMTFISTSPNWSMFYEREKLASIVDYLIVMGYDEHWAASPVAGSVSSLPWVESHLEQLLEIIPNERLILGIPYYTRIWTEQKLEDGSIEVSSSAFGMDDIQQWIEEKGVTPEIDPQSKQYYVEYEDEEEQSTYKIWIEDEHSIAQRAALVHQYGLAGVAGWTRSFASDFAWETLNRSLRQLDAVEPDVDAGDQ